MTIAFFFGGPDFFKDTIPLEVNHHFEIENGGSFWKMINPY